MDRPHDYAAAMAFAQQQQVPNIQQQQQYGFHPQHQQFPPSVHGPPFMPPHPPLQQFPYPQPMQQHQHYPHPPLPHLHQQPPPAFPPHVPPHIVPSSFHGPYDSAPPPAPPPSDPELQKRIDKLVEYAVKNGPEFEAVVREREQENPAYNFLFGGEGHSYYRYKLWVATRHLGGPFNPPFPPSSVPMMHSPMMGNMGSSPLNAPNAAAGVPHMQQHPFPPFYEQQLPPKSQPFIGHGRPEYDQSFRSFKGLPRPLPSDVEMELNGVVNSLTGTKESIKGAKTWFMQRSPFVPALAEALRDRIFSLDDPERQLHIIYLANDILFDSLQRRVNPRELDNEALAFKPVLGSMLARIYHNPVNKEENQSRIQKIIQFWASKDVFDQDTIHGLENEMLSGLAPNSLPGPHRDLPAVALDHSVGIGGPHQAANHNSLQWQPDKQSSVLNMPAQEQAPPIPSISPSLPPQQFHPTSVPPSGFAGPMSVPSSIQQNQPPAPHLGKGGEKLPPYPLFPPGLIPGMVRKMQIGSGVPYSPMSPLDIPTVIPPSNISPSEINEKVSKFFREIGEVNPSEGAIQPPESRDTDDYEYERELPVRKGGACIPPPPSLNMDPTSESFDDESVEQNSGSWRLGLGAKADDPNEASQYDDVYSSYRKQRSTNYHSSMSARAAPR